jgi:hypothetical protein
MKVVRTSGQANQVTAGILRLETNPGAIHQNISLHRARRHANHLAVG